GSGGRHRSGNDLPPGGQAGVPGLIFPRTKPLRTLGAITVSKLTPPRAPTPLNFAVRERRRRSGGVSVVPGRPGGGRCHREEAERALAMLTGTAGIGQPAPCYADRRRSAESPGSGTEEGRSVGRDEFLARLRADFPNVVAQIKPHESGLLHCEVGAFLRATE